MLRRLSGEASRAQLPADSDNGKLSASGWTAYHH